MTATGRFRASSIATAMLVMLAVARAATASDPGVDCAKLKLKAAAKALAAKVGCYTRKDFAYFDVECSSRAETRMATAFEHAELRECFGADDGLAAVRSAVDAHTTALLQMMRPPHPCGLRTDGFTCGGPCTGGRVCVAIGNTCGCASDAFACTATGTVPVLCPKIGQTCVDRACADPAGGYCREEPAGSGSAVGFCPDSSTCLWAGHPQCLSTALSCENPSGVCATTGLTVYGACADRDQTCSAECVCE
jgi:hypothetical protein